MGGAVVLRWKPQEVSADASSRAVAKPSASEVFAGGSSAGGAAFERSDAMVASSHRDASLPASTSNPLRAQVRQVAYQQDSNSAPNPAFPEPGITPPALPSQPSLDRKSVV